MFKNIKNTLSPCSPFMWRVFGFVLILSLAWFIVWCTLPQSLAMCYPKGEDHTAYCDSKGLVQGLSINESGLVVVRVKSPFVADQAAQQGFNIQRLDAMIMTVDASPQKQEMLAQLRLAYQERRPVTLHAHRVERGHLVLDHIWLR